MSDALKKRLMGECTRENHVGPFAKGHHRMCMGCHIDHIDEFSECVGFVEGPVDFNSLRPGEPGYDPEKRGAKVDVRWLPSGLRYAYPPELLEPVVD